jgi:ribonuclease-3
LGGAVLALTVSALLLARFPESSEGEMSRGQAALVKCPATGSPGPAAGWGLPLAGAGRRAGGPGKALSLANALEALLGAVYLDCGLEAAAHLTARWFSPLISSALPGQDFKTSLQEFTHARYKLPPSYHLMAESGPGHARHFKVEVRLQDQPLAQGEGRTKKEAEQQAARRALEILAADGPGTDQNSAYPAKTAED